MLSSIPHKHIMFPSDESNSSEGSNSSSSSRSVSFSTIEVHDHCVVLGDHPFTSCGPSLELDWTTQSSSILDLEQYEANRDPRRSRLQLSLPESMRTDWLLDQGYTLREIHESVSRRSKETKKMKRSQSIVRKLSSFVGLKVSTR